MMVEPALLEVRDAWKAFGGVQAVAGVSLRLGRGEVRALIGPNGAGKTTLFSLLTGQIAGDRGVVLFKGESIRGLPPHRIWRKGISWTFQVAAVFASMTVLENVQVPFLSHGGRRYDLFSRVTGLERERALTLLREVGLAELAERPCGSLSYADLKRLELAIALASDPELLLLDEPTAGMALDERRALVALVGAVVERRGMTVLFTEHDMDVVFAAAHRITVLHQGRVIAEGLPQTVRGNREVQEIYLGAWG
jgi:branched-chain amino acid transport system ATP-binding protein